MLSTVPDEKPDYLLNCWQGTSIYSNILLQKNECKIQFERTWTFWIFNFSSCFRFSCSNLLRDVNKSTPLDYLGISFIFEVLKWSDSQENDKHLAVIFWAPLLFQHFVGMRYNATKRFKLYNITKKNNLVVLALKLELKVKIICIFKGIFTEKLWLVFLFDPCPLWLSHDNSWNFDIKDRKILIQKVKNSPLLGSPNEKKIE